MSTIGETMKIIITPAKRMNQEIDYFEVINKPIYIKESEIILNKLKTLTLNEVKRLLKCNDKIAKEAYDNYQAMNLNHNLIPAMFAYKGIQYEQMAPHILSDDDYQFAKRYLRILSGFYGILRPFDGVVPYRLELNDKLEVDGYHSLYEFWSDKIYLELIKEDKEILDLGAKQYTRIIKKYLTDDVKYVKCYFMEKKANGYQEVGVYVKKARGQMTRYLIKNKVNCFEQVKNFNELGYIFNEEMSNEQNYIFVR